MTCIATDGRTMAGDGRVVGNKNLLMSDTFRKVVALEDGRVFGGCGDVAGIVNAAKWLNAGAPGGADRPELDKDSFEGLVLDADGRVLWFDHDCIFVPYDPPCALGVGTEVALACMRRGETPIRAVRTAATVWTSVGGEITVLKPRRAKR